MTGTPNVPEAFLRACAPLRIGYVSADGAVEWTASHDDGSHARKEADGAISGVATHMDLQLDSRQIRPGDVFAAVKGRTVDGHDFIPQALVGGASLVLCDPSYEPDRIPEAAHRQGSPAPVLLQVADLGERLGSLAHVFYGEPAQGLTLVGVTGTNGKTTVATLVVVVASSPRRAGEPAGDDGRNDLGPAAGRKREGRRPGAHYGGSGPPGPVDAPDAPRRLHALGHGGLFARARPEPRAGLVVRCGRIHQSEPRPPRLPRLHARLRPS